MKKQPEDNKYFHYYNANPKDKDAKDCTYRALSIFLGKPWDEIAKLDAEFFLKHGVWLYSSEYIGTSFESQIHLLMDDLGCKRVQLNPGINRALTVRSFIDEYAEADKIYLISVGGHMTVVKDMKVWDTWDSSVRCPQVIFEKTE